MTLGHAFRRRLFSGMKYGAIAQIQRIGVQYPRASLPYSARSYG
jgi:hypothetical protein